MPFDFSQKPPRILLHPDSCGSGTWRLAEPAMELRKRAQAITLIRKDRFLTDQELTDLQPDIVVVQRALGADHVAAVERYRKTLPDAFIVFDLDDLLWAIPSHSPAVRDSDPSDQIIQRAKKIAGLCDRIVLSTEALRSHWFEYIDPSANVSVVGPFLPDWFFGEVRDGQRRARSSNRDDKRVRIGFAGSVTHTNTLNRLTKIIRQTSDKLAWVFMGCKPEGVDDLIEFHPLCEIDAYPGVLGSLGLDIAVAPFATTSFDYCKTNLRIGELGALGVPVLTDHHDRGQFSRLNRALSSPEAFLDFVASARRNYDADAALDLNRKTFALSENMDTVFQAWMPLGSAKKRSVEWKDVSLIPADAKVYGKSPEPLPLNCGSVSFLTNDGIYPHAGMFSAVTESAATTLPVPDTGLLASILHPFAAGVVLTANAVHKVGMPAWERFGSPEEALIDWGEWAAEHGFEHGLSAAQFVRYEKPRVCATVDLTRAAAWHPKMADRYQANQEKFESGQVALCEMVERLFAAKCLENAAPGVGVKFVINASESEAVEEAGDGTVPVLFADCMGGFLKIVHPPMPNTPEFSLALDDDLQHFVEFINQMGITTIDVKRIRGMTVDDIGALSHLPIAVFPDENSAVIDAIKAQM